MDIIGYLVIKIQVDTITEGNPLLYTLNLYTNISYQIKKQLYISINIYKLYFEISYRTLHYPPTRGATSRST